MRSKNRPDLYSIILQELKDNATPYDFNKLIIKPLNEKKLVPTLIEGKKKWPWTDYLSKKLTSQEITEILNFGEKDVNQLYLLIRRLNRPFIKRILVPRLFGQSLINVNYKEIIFELLNLNPSLDLLDWKPIH